MGRSNDDFVKYPRTPHLFGSSGTPDDKHLGESESLRLLADASLIVEEKLDGTNVGIKEMSGPTRRWSAPNRRSSRAGRPSATHERTVLLFTALFHDA